MDIGHVMVVPEEHSIGLMLLFAQSPRKTPDGVAYLAPGLDSANMDNVSTMSKAQREHFYQGLEGLDAHNEAVGMSLEFPLYSSVGASDPVLIVTDDVNRVRRCVMVLVVVVVAGFLLVLMLLLFS